MLRFWYVIIISLPYIIYYLAKGSYIEKNTERYSEADRYRVALHVIHVMKRNGRIRTSVTGVENLPAEGGYFHNRNAIKEFMPGAFKCAVRANCPIVPVLLVDSYKPFEINSLRRVKTQVHFLPAIYPEEYEGLTTDQIAKLVRNRIVDAMQQKACA